MTHYFVAKNGSDSNDGGWANPFLTIAKGTSVLVAGDVLNIRSGTYTERILMNDTGGTAAKPIIIRSDPDDGQMAVVTSNNTHGLLLDGCSYITVQRLDFRLPTATPGSTVTIQGASNFIIVEDCLIKDAADNGVLITGTNSDCTIRRCTITNCATDGIGTDTTGTRIMIDSCIIDKCGDNTYAGGAGDGVSFHDNCNGTIQNCKIRRCSKGGITNVQNAGHTVKCFGNFISDCVQWSMAGHQNGTNTIGNHIWVGNVILMSDTSALLGGTQPRGMMFRGRTDAVNHFEVYNNVVVNLIANILAISYGDFGNAYTIKVTMRNNVSYTGSTGTGKHVWISNQLWWDNGTTVNYNAYSSNTGQQFAEDVTGFTFAQWQAQTEAPDANGGVVSPLFVNQSALVTPGAYNWETDANRWPAARKIEDFMLQDGSVLRGMGTNVAGAEAYTDAAGLTRPSYLQSNIGAFFGAATDAGGFEDASLNSEQSSGPSQIEPKGGGGVPILGPSKRMNQKLQDKGPPRARMPQNMPQARLYRKPVKR